MDAKQRATAAFEAVEPELQEISRWMYENPELAYQEIESSRRMARFMADRGFSVTIPAHGLETSFEATAGSSGPRVIICCEYDALPGVGHACGHNIIATAAVGAGAALGDLAGELDIRVTVLGTPAEEAGGGKVDLLRAGAFEDAAAAIMIHPIGGPDIVDYPALAVHGFTVEFHGKEAHAAGTPHLGINALDAFVQAYSNLAMLRQAMLPTDRVHCIITDGGHAPNVIPHYTRSEWLVRASSGDRLEELIGKVRACLDAASVATGCRLELTDLGHPYVEMVSNPTLSTLYAENSALLGRPMAWWDEVEGEAPGSTDMGNVSQVVPSIQPVLTVDAGGADNHELAFAAATITPSGDRAIRDGALAMAYTVIDLAEQGAWDRL